MGVYIGVDFHARKQTVSYLTTEDGEIQQVELEHEKDNVRAFYEQFRGQKVIVGFESSGYAAWFEELLEELEYETWIGHAAAIRQFARRRQKNDRRDADLILELMVRGDFPRLHRYSRESRETLQQLRYRQRLVKMRTMVINSLRFMVGSRGVTLRGHTAKPARSGAIKAGSPAGTAGPTARRAIEAVARAPAKGGHGGGVVKAKS